MAYPGRRERTVVLVATALAFAAFLVGPGISPPLSASPPDMASSQSLLGPEEQALVDLINTYRLENGVSPLIVSPTLTHAARWMSQDMAENGYLNHTDSLGRDFRQRLADFGYDYNTYIGEDLAKANDNYQTTFLLWQSSPGHEANMLSPNYRVIGVSRTHDGISSYGWYWVADFGGYDDSGVPPLLTIEPAPTPTPTPTPTPIPTPTPTPTSTPESESQVLPWVTGPASSHMQDDTLHNCPQPGSWAISVWNGADSTETSEVLDTCGEGNVDFAYYIDPDTQDWLHYFVGLTEFSDLPALDNGQAVITHGAAGASPPTPTSPDVGPVADKWTLWTEGTRLRGANIYQRRVYPELDDSSMGTGPVGPPYTQEDFDRLAALGANYVNISHPGLFSETPPYTLDQGIQDNLDSLLDMIAEADMFAVISFRTGPGRSEFTFFHDEVGTWFDDSYLNDSVWQDQAAQDGWVAMWRQTAERYRNNPIVAGYDLMVEPNANDFWLDVWEPEEFYPTYADTLYDWNQLHPHITAAIREVDADTPILIGGMSYSAVEWLPYLQPNADSRTVYTAHQYQPFQYTHQTPPLERTYPGVFDTDWDGVDDEFNRAWLEGLLSAVDTFASTHSVPMAANEFGIMRWEPGAADFMDDQMGLFEDLDMNHALWLWEASWEPRAAMNDDFNFLHGPDPDHHTDVSSSDLIDVIVQYWGRNTVRPSNFSEQAVAQGTLHNCPQPGKWALSVWTGADGTDISEAVASCTEATVAAAYWIDPQSQDWKHYFSALPEITTLETLNWMQGAITLGKG